jgi:hypothetical protein
VIVDQEYLRAVRLAEIYFDSWINGNRTYVVDCLIHEAESDPVFAMLLVVRLTARLPEHDQAVLMEILHGRVTK